MTLQTDFIQRALRLPLPDRAELARQLILSLDADEPDEDADAAWEGEVERRLGSLDRGEAQMVEWRQAVERVRASLKKRGPA